MTHEQPVLWLVRHGETAWTVSGRHTGRTDIGLTARGERQAVALGRRLGGQSFTLVLTSPLARARDTCRLAGYGSMAAVEPDAQEWDYGRFEGMTSAQIRALHPSWSLWEDGAPDGETIGDVTDRADRLIARVARAGGSVALFAHGHVLRLLAARWIGLPPSAGGSFALDTASVSLLAVERGQAVIRHWNQVCHLESES
ncbi:MAG: histidine phosphatase family protein [Vicinamibacterales bacterium]